MRQSQRAKSLSRLLFDVDPSVFDGNYSDGVSRWLFPLPGTAVMEDEAVDQLMAMTVEDRDLSWVLFPPGPFRL